MSIEDIFDSLNAFTNPCFIKKNRLSADLNKAVIPINYFFFDFINTEGYLGMKDLPDS